MDFNDQIGESMYTARESTQNLRLAKSYIEALKKIPQNINQNADDYLKQECQYNEMLHLAYKHLDRALNYTADHKSKHITLS